MVNLAKSIDVSLPRNYKFGRALLPNSLLNKISLFEMKKYTKIGVMGLCQVQISFSFKCQPRSEIILGPYYPIGMNRGCSIIQMKIISIASFKNQTV
jgi:hypothetical protein